MRNIFPFLAIILVVILLTACGGTGTTDKKIEPLKPGDQVGSVRLVSEQGEEFTHYWDLKCDNPDDPAKVSHCEAAVGEKVNISIGIYDDKHTGNLDEKWANHTLELFIDGNPVDLESFGSIIMANTIYGDVRLWNVMIVADKPDKVTIHQKFGLDNLLTDYSFIITFKKP